MATKKTSQSDEVQNANQQEQAEVVYTKSAQFTLNFTRGVLFTIICTVLTLVVSLLVTNLCTPNWVNGLTEEVKRKEKEKNKNSLLLVGSGTVYEYLKDIDKDSSLLKDVVSMPIPTMPALKALREEKRPQQGENLSWIIMSAMEAGDTLIMGQKERDDFYDNIGMIVRLYLKDDPLEVIVHPKDLFNKQDSFITIKELSDLLARKDSLQFKLFRTSDGSSTRTLFEESLGFKILENESDFFDMNTTKSTFQDSKCKNQFIILGSEIYKPKDKGLLENCNSYFFVNNSKEIKEIKKHLYLYFTAYWDNTITKSKLELMPQTEEFIKKIAPNFKFDRNPSTKQLIDDATK